MTLPTTTTLNSCDDDSDMFGPPRSSPIGYHHHRSRVPMISPKLRQREERKRILQPCAHKLERIKDSETNLRRSVCINNTYCRLTDELRREKQSRYLANLPKSDSKPESARENIFNPYNSCGIDSSNHQPSNKLHMQNELSTNNMNDNAGRCLLDSDDEDIDIINNNNNNKHNNNMLTDIDVTSIDSTTTITAAAALSSSNRHDSSMPHDACNYNNNKHHHQHTTTANTIPTTSSPSSHSNATAAAAAAAATHSSSSASSTTTTPSRKRHSCSSKDLDTDLEILDRELNAINTPMPLIDPEITQGAEQLEKAISRKRARSEDDNDRLVREALQFYMPPPRVISAIEDGPLDLGGLMMGGIGPCGMGMGSMGMGGMSMGLGMMGMAGMSMGVTSCSGSSSNKRQKLNGSSSVSSSVVSSSSLGSSASASDLVELDFELTNQNQKEFEVIMDALRLGTPSPTPSVGSDSCGQAAMMMSESANVFHNLVVTSLET